MATTATPGEAARPALALANSRRNEEGPVDELATPAIEIVSAAAASAPTASRLSRTDPAQPHQERHHVGAGGVQLACALLAGDAIDLIAGPAHADLLACPAPGCVRLLLRDHPRRRWCSTRCGDRVRASRCYYRHRDGGAAP